MLYHTSRTAIADCTEYHIMRLYILQLQLPANTYSYSYCNVNRFQYIRSTRDPTKRANIALPHTRENTGEHPQWRTFRTQQINYIAATGTLHVHVERLHLSATKSILLDVFTGSEISFQRWPGIHDKLNTQTITILQNLHKLTGVKGTLKWSLV